MPSDPGERTTSAPYALIREMRSLDMVSGITMTALYPRAAAIIEIAMPVLPDVGSMIVPPSSSRPLATASSIIDRAARSFMEPAGLPFSILTYTCVPGGVILFRRTRGVSPMVSVMLE